MKSLFKRLSWPEQQGCARPWAVKGRRCEGTGSTPTGSPAGVEWSWPGREWLSHSQPPLRVRGTSPWAPRPSRRRFRTTRRPSAAAARAVRAGFRWGLGPLPPPPHSGGACGAAAPPWLKCEGGRHSPWAGTSEPVLSRKSTPALRTPSVLLPAAGDQGLPQRPRGDPYGDKGAC